MSITSKATPEILEVEWKHTTLAKGCKMGDLGHEAER